MKKMPDSFAAMARGFGVEMEMGAASPEARLDRVIGWVALADRPELAAYIDHLLAEGSGACRRAWRKSDSNVQFFRSADVVAVLRQIRARL